MADPIESALERLKTECWGRFGADDELGSLNHMDSSTKLRAAALIMDGDSVSLSRPVKIGRDPGHFGSDPVRRFLRVA